MSICRSLNAYGGVITGGEWVVVGVFFFIPQQHRGRWRGNRLRIYHHAAECRTSRGVRDRAEARAPASVSPAATSTTPEPSRAASAVAPSSGTVGNSAGLPVVLRQCRAARATGVYIAGGATLNNYQACRLRRIRATTAPPADASSIQTATLSNTDTALITGGEGRDRRHGRCAGKTSRLSMWDHHGGAATYGVGGGDASGSAWRRGVTLTTSAVITGGAGVTYKTYGDGMVLPGGAGVQITGDG